MSERDIGGSCLCGAVAYRIAREPVWIHHCHCSRCRKIRGTANATNAFVPVDDFEWVRGEERLRFFKPPDAERFTHAFCEVCGSSLPFLNHARGVAVIPMGSFDVDPGTRPKAHIFVASKAVWDEISDALPQFAENIPSGNPKQD